MTVTILDLLSRLPNIATEHRGELLNQENPFVTIITEVSRELPVHTDFELNGKVAISGKFNEVVRMFGSTGLDEICDFSKKNIKLGWSKEVIDPADEGALFKLNLTLRITSFDPSTNTVNFVALRNQYGSSTITLTHQIEK